jgi:integrase
VDKYISLGSQVFEKASDWKKYDGENPFEGRRFNPKKGKKPGALTPEEVVAIQNEIGHPVKRAMVGFDFYSGWRISEVCKLTWDDVDLEKGTAWLVDPKNGETVEMELDDRAVAIIANSERYGDHVFCRKNGKPFKGRLQRVMKNAAKRAGVELPPRKAWHILRRTWASMMLQRGCDVETLRVLGNWKHNDMPLWYAEAAGKEQRRAALSRLPSLDNEGANGRNMAEIKKVVALTA